MPGTTSLPAIPSATPCVPLHWQEARHWPERRRLEHLIRRRFAEAHGARIHHFLPRLFGLWQGDRPRAAVGLRAAHTGPLFQERYLDGSVEALLAMRFGEALPRREIAEIGNLASALPGLQCQLFLHLVAQLVEEGLAWLVFTATPEVANGIHRLGLELHPLLPADPARLGDAQADWGRYYERRPWVMAGDLRLAHADLLARGLLPLNPENGAEAPHARLA